MGSWSVEEWSKKDVNARKTSTPLDQRPLNGVPPPLVARRRAKRPIIESVAQYEQQRTSCEREGREDEAVSTHDLADDVVMDVVCRRAYRITEEDFLGGLKGEAGMLDTAL